MSIHMRRLKVGTGAGREKGGGGAGHEAPCFYPHTCSMYTHQLAATSRVWSNIYSRDRTVLESVSERVGGGGGEAGQGRAQGRAGQGRAGAESGRENEMRLPTNTNTQPNACHDSRWAHR
jgi:hypothetical protein